ncbi:MAG TPA: S1 RNA-binding domain-containing protein, partial [Candidatus Limnocylindrales bacterium]|nr:S1 RNA-binding domain-containing protein [Candidatus Limnocylindrales bacterium]
GYKVGDEVEAEVIDINHERGRISLSIRRLQPDPWESTVADFKVGDVIDGTVTKLVNFGAFVRVREGLEGLIHISELSHQRVAHPGDVVHEGQVLKLKIISLDSERHRLGLSLKQAEEPPARPMPELGAPAAPAGERRERRERRERPERSYSPSDALAEPEGGIDTTLAAAFAQVRAQLADAEASDEPAAATATPAEEAPVAAETDIPVVEAATDDAPRSQVAETAAEGALTVGAAGDAPAEAEATAEVEVPAAEPETAGAETPAAEAETVEAETPATEVETSAAEADAPAAEAEAAPAEAPATEDAPEAEAADAAAAPGDEPATEETGDEAEADKA